MTHAIGLINEALDIEFKPFNVSTGQTTEELDGLGFDEARERMRELERARANLLRSIATSADRSKELAESWGIIYDEPHGHLRAVLDQLVIELAHTPGAQRGLRFVPAGTYIDQIGRGK